MVVQAVRRVLVLGGGSAGWLTAGLLAAAHRTGEGGLSITVVESATTPPIGVGEGTWPSMRDTLRRIGLSEVALLREAHAAFKQGSRFDGWVSGVDGDHYHHPFTLPEGHDEADLPAVWLEQHARTPFADLVCAQPHVCAAGLAPKQASTPEFAAVVNYAYHFDAARFGELLREHCTQQLGVAHVVADVTAVRSHDNGDIAALATASHGELGADLFIDCSGLASLLLGAHYGVGLVAQRDVLFNDRALALQVPHAQPGAALATQTVATAQQAGWIWDIALPSRRGIGHVYSSAHSSDDEAAAALMAYVHRHVGRQQELPAPRRIAFSPGYRERFWHRNCLAIGLSAGFIEPLEASALALVEMSAAMLADNLPADRAEMEIVARRFNDAFAYRWERVIEFLKLHYVLSRRHGAYWRDHRRDETVPERLREQLLLWRHRPPSRHDLPRVEEVFPSASYQYVLYGMGFRPLSARGSRRVHTADAAQAHLLRVAERTRRLLAALPKHRTLVEQVLRHGFAASE
jgi:tryptophan 7-halogenase